MGSSSVFVAVLLATIGTASATSPDEIAVRTIVQDEIAAWNSADAVAYSRHFATDGTFTNIRGQFFTGREAMPKPLLGTQADEKGRLRTRLLQVLVKDGGEWRIAAYHNTDVKHGVSVPEPR